MQKWATSIFLSMLRSCPWLPRQSQINLEQTDICLVAGPALVLRPWGGCADLWEGNALMNDSHELIRLGNSIRLKIEYIPTHALKMNTRSPRICSERQIAMQARNIDTFGFPLACP